MPERLIKGRYRLGDLLGSGGVARVYRARDELLGVQRAVKLLHGQSDAQTRARLLREAQLMAALHHPAVLHVYDIGEQEESGDFVVMDLAEGGSLADWVEERGPLPPAEAVRHLRRLLSALQAAHAAGIVHRDVKPQNILLDRDGQALLADFGIARAPLTEDPRTTRTSVGLGSMCFMAPEQRLDAKSAGPTADIYAAGCTLYALLCDENPIDLFTAEEDSARWLPIPPPLRPILIRATRHKPQERYASAEAMDEALAAIHIGAQAPVARAPNPATRVPTQVEPPRGPALPVPARRSRRWLWPGFALVCAVGLWSALPERKKPELAPVEAPTLPPEPTPPEPTTPEPTTPEPTTPEPTPPKAKNRPPKAAPSPSDLTGAWTLSFNGRPAKLTLSGADDTLRGTVTTWLNASDTKGVSVEVEGRYDAALKLLTLTDVGQTTVSGAYTLHMSNDFQSFSGSFDRKDGTYNAPLTGYREPK